MAKRGMEFVPLEYRRAFRSVSKAHLADVVWNLCGRLADGGLDHIENIFTEACRESARVSFDRGDLSIVRAHSRITQRIAAAELRAQKQPESEDE